ncbi:PRD domain-containing protein [Marinilactibacillus psychrotolerans]|uniref:DNA translocase FtsK n=1 Tax=Marinilactibacillus psychrotolerans TaxID=191770 RepID=A0A5R9C2F6_9LACT|nr:sigma-54-dependent transcriptional regulator [Marinilactibacillus psychrotolerans]TLQ06940.1 PRD domain-containing protein [Marinilactibacillus psychrotolerans]
MLKYLENQTAFIDLETVDELFTAKKIAEVFHIKRNTVSHYLNILNEEGYLVKVNTRPVYYFHKIAFENQFFSLKKIVYSNFNEIKIEQPLFQRKQDLFSLLIGHDKSLNRCVEQIKTALYYPDNGLPVLITGESGTGKSYLVQLIYKYCLENELIDEKAALITLNCAQYANNPELLTSNLFGHVKGAYTGADQDKKGSFEAASEGVLFLDEVHRLNPENQEKLFTFLDQGIIYRMGDTNHPIHLKTRLFFATTEELESNFLTTFIRRIPIQVEMPALEKRSRSERLELIYSFLLTEQRRINSSLRITGQVLSLLTSRSFKGNIGELENTVKVTVAKAFLEQKNEDEIKISIHHLPEKLLENITSNVETTISQDILISENMSIEQLLSRSHPKQKRVITTFERIIKEFQKNDCQLIHYEESLKKEVENLFDFLLFETDRYQKHEMLIYLTQYIRETFKQMGTSYQIKFNGNSIYALSYYLFQRGGGKWYPEDQEIHRLIKLLEAQIEVAYPTSYHYVVRILELCQPKLDLEISDMDKVLLTLYLKQAERTKELGIPKAIIVAHGYATASSIANVTNRFLGKDIFESFDMPLDVTPQQIAEEIIDYSEHNDITNGLVILVDMGSLKEIYQFFPKQITTPIVIMNNVNTPLAIAIGENLQKKLSLKEMIEQSIKDAKLDWEIIYPQENKRKILLTTCFTGIGTAKQVCTLLEKSVPSSCDLKIFPYEYNILKEKKRNEPVFSMYDVLGVIGTADPEIKNTPYLSLEDLISGDKEQKLTDWLRDVMTPEESKIFNTNIIRNFSLEKVIDSVTILDTEKVMREIEIFMRELENLTNITINNAKKLALYVHVSCLIERLIRNIPIESYMGYDSLYQCHKSNLHYIKEAFSVIEKDYSVEIPESEIAYIFDILYKNVENSINTEDF